MTPDLGVNIDHVATLRQVRVNVSYPDPVQLAVLAELGGANGITVHLREDRRHIQDRDLELLRATVQIRLNLEMAATAPMLALAVKVRPDFVTLVPEKRQELTTEGGLALRDGFNFIRQAIHELHAQTLPVSLFLDPDADAVHAARDAGADAVELHTGEYANAGNAQERGRQLQRLFKAAEQIREGGMRLHAGHGLHYHNVAEVAAIRGMAELNIGHSIVARALSVGMQAAVREMKELLKGACLPETRATTGA